MGRPEESRSLARALHGRIGRTLLALIGRGRPRRAVNGPVRAVASAALLTLIMGAAKPAAQPPVVEEISWRPYGLVVKASAPLSPEIFTLDKPFRFVVDLPSAELADTALSQTIPINAGGLKQVRLARKGRTDVRMVVDCDAPTGLQVVQPGDRTTLVITRAGQNSSDLMALLKGETEYAGAGQEIESIWARDAAGALKLQLHGAKGLTYALFEDDPNHFLIKLPRGHFHSILPSPTGPLKAISQKTGPDGLLTLDVTLKDSFYQLSEAPSRDHSTLNLTWNPVAPHRFAGRPLVVIDPGHGGADPGAIGPDHIDEKTVCLALAKSLQHALWDKHINAVLTRSSDAEMYLAPRLALIDRTHADLLISLHANSHTTPDSTGTETYWREPQSQAFASTLDKQVTTLLGRPDRGIKQERLYMCRHPKVPSILLETGFISNPTEEHMLADPHFQARAAAAIEHGVETYWTAAKGPAAMAKASKDSL